MEQILTPETISTVMSLCVIPILGVVAKFIIMFLKSKTTELEQKISNEALLKYIKLAEDAVETAVVSVNQTFVDNMKKEGAFDLESAGRSFDLAKHKAITIMGTTVKKALTDVYSDLDGWLDSKIEFYVRQNKRFSELKP